jgi:hypothetical protein
MGYRVPQFNLFCNIGQPDSPGIPAVPALAGWARLYFYPCALAWGHRDHVAWYDTTDSPAIGGNSMFLLLPLLTDVRGAQDSVSNDVVEVPADSGRWYWVYGVDDSGKGWANEYRCALIVPINRTWNAPYS